MKIFFSLIQKHKNVNKIYFQKAKQTIYSAFRPTNTLNIFTCFLSNNACKKGKFMLW